MGAALLGILAAGCTGVSVQRDSPNSGTFSSTAWNFTILSMDLPRPALMIARSNAADIQRPDMRIENEWLAPDLGWFDWLLDIIGFRYAKVSGTWGYHADSGTAGSQPAAPTPDDGSN